MSGCYSTLTDPPLLSSYTLVSLSLARLLCATAGCIAILKASLQVKTLQSLSLSKNDVGAGNLVGSTPPLGFELWHIKEGTSVTHARHARYLTAACLPLTWADDLFCVVADLLRRDWRLLSLDLSHCNCSQQGMETMAEGLLINRRLSCLFLDGNKGGYEEEPWCRSVLPFLGPPFAPGPFLLVQRAPARNTMQEGGASSSH